MLDSLEEGRGTRWGRGGVSELVSPFVDALQGAGVIGKELDTFYPMSKPPLAEDCFYVARAFAKGYHLCVADLGFAL
jgi:hypothetical protein